MALRMHTFGFLSKIVSLILSMCITLMSSGVWSGVMTASDMLWQSTQTKTLILRLAWANRTGKIQISQTTLSPGVAYQSRTSLRNEPHMAMNKSIENGKEKRKPYRGSKAFDKTCRNHGGCDWCKKNRTIAYTKEKLKMDNLEEDWEDADEET